MGLLSADVSAAAMTPEDFRDFVAGAIGIVLSDQELITLLRNCSVPDTADIDGADRCISLPKDARSRPVPGRCVFNLPNIHCAAGGTSRLRLPRSASGSTRTAGRQTLRRSASYRGRVRSLS